MDLGVLQQAVMRNDIVKLLGCQNTKYKFVSDLWMQCLPLIREVMHIKVTDPCTFSPSCGQKMTRRNNPGSNSHWQESWQQKPGEGEIVSTEVEHQKDIGNIDPMQIQSLMAENKGREEISASSQSFNNKFLQENSKAKLQNKLVFKE